MPHQWQQIIKKLIKKNMEVIPPWPRIPNWQKVKGKRSPRTALTLERGRDSKIESENQKTRSKSLLMNSSTTLNGQRSVSQNYLKWLDFLRVRYTNGTGIKGKNSLKTLIKWKQKSPETNSEDTVARDGVKTLKKKRMMTISANYLASMLIVKL